MTNFLNVMGESILHRCRKCRGGSSTEKHDKRDFVLLSLCFTCILIFWYSILCVDRTVVFYGRTLFT
eukprot:UN02235